MAGDGGRTITRRKILIGIGLGTVSAALPSLAQQGKVSRIGILSARCRSTPANPDRFCDAFVQGFRELGYVEGKILVIEWRFADGKYDRLPRLATELMQLKPDVIVSHATPGGNITGLSLATTDHSTKYLESLTIMVPGLSRIAVLMNPGTSFRPAVLKSIQTAAKARGVEVVPLQAGNPDEIERGFERMARERVKAVMTDRYALPSFGMNFSATPLLQ